MIRFRTVAILAISLAITAPAWAGGGRNQADQLPSKDDQVAVRGTGSDDSVAEQRHRQDVQRLLNRLEAGQPVDPNEVERVLRDSLNE